MTRAGSAAWLPALAALAGERLGLDYPRERWADLERSIDVAAREQGDDNTEAFARRLLGAAAGGEQLDLLARALTVGETYFFRERRSFEVLEQDILPALIAERRASSRHLRLWSASCCSGEEAYSLAMVVDRLLPLPQRQGWDVSILATDVNPHFLRRAVRAEFGPWSFRDAPEGLQARYFTPAGDGRLALLPHIRQMVSFGQLNLAGTGYPSARSGTESMDLILCRNVLMYFTPQQAQRVMGRLQAALRDGGWLCVGAAEAPLKTLQGLMPAAIDGAAFYRKAAASAPQPAPSGVAPAGPLPTATPPPAPRDNATPDPLQHARALADAGALEPARAAVEKLVAAAKLDPEAHYLHAVILQELGQDAGAEQALKRALYLDPDFALAHHALGQLALRGGRPTPAQRHFHHALAALERLDAASVLPHSGGLAAGHLRAVIQALLAGRGAS
jgi:chemotaxis protein methyltransferase CheR